MINKTRTPLHYGVRVFHELAEHYSQTLGEIMQFATEAARGNPDVGMAVRVSNMVMTATTIALNEAARKSNVDRHYTLDDVVDMIDDDNSLMEQFTKLTFDAIIARNQNFTTGQSSPKNQKRPTTRKK